MPARADALVVTCALALALGGLGRDARAYCRTTTQGRLGGGSGACSDAGVPIAWAGACASLSMDPRVLPDGLTREAFGAEIRAAAARWQGADCGGGRRPSFRFVAYPDCPRDAVYARDAANANTVGFRPRWGDDEYHPPEVIAVTVTSYDVRTGAIRDTDTELNLRGPSNSGGFRFVTGAPARDEVHLQTVLAHELGHAQGLAHTPVASAVMWSSAGHGAARDGLDPDDVAGICAVYPPERDAGCAPEPERGFACADRGCACAIERAGAAPRRDGVASVAALAAVACAAASRRVSARRAGRSPRRP